MIRRIRSWRVLLLLLVALVEQRPCGGLLPQSNAFSTTTPASSIGSPRHRSLSAPVPNALSSSCSIATSNRGSTSSRQRLPSVLQASLWDRLELEEDEEPLWYLLNCVAGNELDLLRQCQMACADFDSTDVAKFVVPTVQSVRSHGANRMVKDVKVKYLGYVFAKVRLCRHVYETLQSLDLCRSWMGTVNHRGYRKLPPAPLALNEEEIEKFGLEREDVINEILDGTDEARSCDSDGESEGDGVIVDTAERDELDNAKAIDPKELKVYQGLKVEDMVKVTAQNKFWNEDGIVRRLKDGKILVRFYTYGSMYEEWLSPSDVRKLSSMEILRGLAGPSQPVTQRDFDGDSNDRYGGPGAGPSRGPRRDSSPFQPAFGGGAGQERNRRQDRTANRFRNDRFSNDDERRRDDRNWNWYKDQQQQQQQQQRGSDRRSNSFFPNGRGDFWSAQAGDPVDDNNDDALRDVDSQWGRSNDRMSAQPRRQQQQQQRQQPGRETNRFENRRVQSAIEGRDDWSAFVSRTPSPGADRRSDGRRSRDEFGSASDSRDRRSSGKNSDGSLDDFFDSLMDGLSKDLGADKASYDADGPSADPRRRRDRTTEPATAGGNRKSSKDDDDDAFFASLMSELQDSVGETKSSTDTRQEESSRRSDSLSMSGASDDSDSMFDDFLSSLGEESAGVSQSTKDERDDSMSASPRSSKRKSSATKKSEASYDDDDDFFASLAAELDADTSARGTSGADTSVVPIEILNVDEDDAKSTVARKSSSKKAATTSSKEGGGTGTNLEALTVPALKEMLKERGLKVTGKKSELIERLSS